MSHSIQDRSKHVEYTFDPKINYSVTWTDRQSLVSVET